MLGEYPKEVSYQQWDVFRSFAQRRDHDRKDIQAVVQIHSEPPFIYHLIEILIGRRHYPHIDSFPPQLEVEGAFYR
jgi:hypothetical protein